jgi:molybdate transport system substrate-binding protein
VYRKGAAKPDVATTEKFKQALLAAKSVAYLEAGLTATHVKGVLQKLGIADAVQGKAVNLRAAEAVAEGKADIGVTQISEILPVAGAELAGLLPDDIQERSVFPAAIATNSKSPDAARALIKFLTLPAAAKLLKAKGLDPAG